MFRCIAIILVLSLRLCIGLKAQNLVNNSSFEDITCLEECSNGIVNNRLIADHWWSATSGSPDIFSPCNIIVDPVDSTILCDLWGVPQNWLGFKHAHTGQNYAGYFYGIIYFKDSIIPEGWREFPQAALKQPLIAGKKYCIGLYITPAMRFLTIDNKKLYFYVVTNQTGIYLSSSRLFASTFNAPQVIPQIVLKSDNNQYIADTADWERLYAPYIAAGGEQYLTIGNFSSPSEMIMHVVSNMPQAFIDSSGDSGFCIHYIDDVEVIEITELEAKADTNSIYKGNRVWLYSPTQAEEYTWFAGDTLNKIGSGDSLRVNPIETTTYYLKALQCKLTTYDTVTITVLPAPLIPINVSVVNTLTNSEFTIKYIGDNRPELQAELFNSVGQIVRRLVFTETMNVGVSGLAAGIYYCRLSKDNVPVLTQKIVKVR